MRVPGLFSILLQIFLAGFGKNSQSDGVKLKHLIQPLTEDMRAVCAAYNVPLAEAAKSAGESGLLTMWQLLTVVCRNRAYDDAHPAFQSGEWKRVLPFDGRDYCFYYANGANDSHVQTLLRAVQANLA